MSDSWGPLPNFLESDDYRGIWREQAKASQRTGREGLWSESGEDPDGLRQMPYPSYLKTEHWDIVRRRSLAIAEHRCFYCGATQRLDVHHLSYRRLGCELDEDLIVLCRPCHEIEHLTQDERDEAHKQAEQSRSDFRHLLAGTAGPRTP